MPSLPEEVPRPEEVAGPEVWSKLSEAEKKARVSAYDAEIKKIKDAVTAQKKEDTTSFHKFTKLQVEEKNQFLLDIAQREESKIIKSRLVLRPVTETEKIKIFRAIRWAHMSHEELVEASMI